MEINANDGNNFAERARKINERLFIDLDHRLFGGVEVIRELSKQRNKRVFMPIVYTSAIGLADQNRQITGKFDGGITQTPQVFIDCQAMDGDFGLQINWDVREGVFPDGMIDDMFDLFQQRIEELAKDETDWNKINGLFLPQWQADERNVANHTETDLPIHLLQSGFMEWAQKAPDRVAVTDGEKKLTYGELHQYALKIRQKIVNVGAKHQDCIAIAMNKSIYQVAAVLGTLYAGCIYVPIVADQEIERAKKILEITNANIVLTTVAENSEYMSGKAIIEVDALSDIKFETELPEYGLEDVAYIIFTSGSTGEPKGVTITHAAAVNTIEDINNKNKVTCDDSVLGLSKLNFDLSVYDIFGLLQVGGKIVYPIQENYMNPDHWIKMIEEHRITIWNSVPALMKILLTELETMNTTHMLPLRCVLLSGDWIPVNMPSQIKEIVPMAKINCLGGATEASIWSINHEFCDERIYEKIPYGKPLSNQAKVVGDFTTNILFDFSASDMKGTIAEQLKFIRNKLYEYCDHSSYEGVEIIRDMIKTGKISQEKPLPIVFTSMLFGNLPNLSEMDVVYSQSQTSQVSLDNQTYKLEDGGLIVWDFIKKIYPETMVEEMFSYYCMVIEQLSKNDGELKCSPAFEKKIKLYNSTEKEIDFFNLGKRLDNIFYKFADKIAITDFEGGITYRELERNIKSTMHDLKKNGIKPGKYVVIKTDKSKESIITILAVVLAGATYVPVEKHWPVERVQYILDNAGADMIIDPYEVCSSNEVNDSWKNIDVESSTYVIYTSGSTGKPKGVEIAYKSMVNTVLDINDRIGLNSSDTILGLSSLCFDLSVYDLFATFFTGAQLKLVKELRDTEDIKKLVDSSSDIVWNSVPAAMELFIDSLDEDYKNDEMKAVLLSGDWINVNLPDKIKKHFPKAAIFSLGGATEASIWSIYYPIKKVDASWTSIPYGYPLTNQSIYILDSEQRICPPEVIGEIYIGGIGVAKGYINDEEKTSNSFVKSKYGRLYRTGDFGKYSREGYVIFCGRRDSQVKIGGYRIELEEIEAQIKEVPNIKDCIAVVNYKNQIVVFYKGEELDIAEIKRAIRKKLPTYMYPHRYYRVDDFPLNTNEKIDRKMLKSMADSGIQNKMHNEKQDDLRNPSLNKVIEIWSEVLNCDVEPENDFFELGGDSIKAQRIVRKIADNFKVKISFLTVIHSKNVAEFSKEVEKISLSFKNSKKDEATSAGSKQDNQNVFPLTGVQLAYLNGRNDNYELGKYNAHYYFEAETEYTANQIEYAIRKEVSRHDALRTIFYKNGRQKILNNVPDYSVIVTKCQNDEEKEIELQKQRKILSHKVYDHEKWPLFTFQMIESPNSRILMVSLDLMVCDGDSMQILFTEIADTLEGKSDAEKIEYSYAEYIQNISNQKNSESYEEDKAYWLNKIDSLSSYPQIPMKMKLADCRDYNIVRKSAIIDSVLWGNFKETARRHKVSPSALLCTLYGRIMAKWGNQSEVLLNLTVFQRQQKNTEKIIGDFTKLLPLNLVFAKEDIWKSAERVQEQIMKELDHLSFDGTEIMRELAKRRGVFGKALLPVVFTCVLFDCPENYFERLGSIKYAVSQTPQVFLDNQITEMGGRLHISWDVVDELFEACIIDEIFLEFVEDIKRISENNKANSTNDFVTKVWGNILTKEIITKSVVPDLLKNIDLKQIKILDYAQELCPPDVKGQVYVSESEIMNDRNKTYYKILEHPLYGRMADTGIIGVLTHDGYMEFVVPNCETSVETPDKKEDTHEEEIEKPIVKEIMKIWKEVFEIEDISIQDDFYTLGGDSIILMRLVDEMCKTLGCDVTVDDILQSENISDLANRV